MHLLNTQERELEIAALREKSLKDTEKVAKQIRFGLFSSPPPLAVGDDAKYIKKFHPRDETTGKPAI